ncbi:MAG: metallophosphoesterase [Cyclobacteriaceae bacterium]
MNRATLCICFSCLIWLELPCEARQTPSQGKLFSFGVIADIQYADADKAGKRDYRNSLHKLEYGIQELNKEQLSFVVSIGDVIDRDYKSFEKPLEILGRSKATVHNVIGNHEYSIDDKYKGEVKNILGNRNGFFSIEIKGILFIMLDGTDLSTLAYPKDSKKYRDGLEAFEKVKQSGSNNAYDWNGGIGKKQFSWLEKQLKKADRENLKVVLFCHWPLLPENGTQLWNNKEVLKLLEGKKSVVAWIAGHHHSGGYEFSNGIHHLTMKGMVEAQTETSCGIMEVYADRLWLRGIGDQPDQVMPFK